MKKVETSITYEAKKQAIINILILLIFTNIYIKKTKINDFKIDDL